MEQKKLLFKTKIEIEVEKTENYQPKSFMRILIIMGSAIQQLENF